MRKNVVIDISRFTCKPSMRIEKRKVKVVFISLFLFCYLYGLCSHEVIQCLINAINDLSMTKNTTRNFIVIM